MYWIPSTITETYNNSVFFFLSQWRMQWPLACIHRAAGEWSKWLVLDIRQLLNHVVSTLNNAFNRRLSPSTDQMELFACCVAFMSGFARNGVSVHLKITCKLAKKKTFYLREKICIFKVALMRSGIWLVDTLSLH